MNGKKAKALRRMAREELIERPPERELVASARTTRTAVNSPNSVRGMQRQLKKAYLVALKQGARIVAS